MLALACTCCSLDCPCSQSLLLLDPQAIVIVMSLGFIGFVTILHIIGKVHLGSATMPSTPANFCLSPSMPANSINVW